MNRTEKEAAVAELREKLGRAQAVIVTEFRGLTVAKVNELRRALQKVGAGHQVVKNTLARVAVDGTDFGALKDGFTGPVAVTFAYQDAVATAKVLTQFAKDNAAVTLRCGALQGRLLSASDVEALSKLPGREQLVGQLLSVLVGPLRGLVGVLSGVPRQLVQVLHAVEQKKAA